MHVGNRCADRDRPLLAGSHPGAGLNPVSIEGGDLPVLRGRFISGEPAASSRADRVCSIWLAKSLALSASMHKPDHIGDASSRDLIGALIRQRFLFVG